MENGLNRNELIYVQLADLIRNEIIHGEIEKVPGIRELATRFSVNFKTANKAVSQLINEGYLYRVRGKGTFVIKKVLAIKEDIRIGFLLPNILNPYFSYLAHITETLGYEQNITVLVATGGSNARKTDTVMQEFVNQKVDTIILHGGVLKSGAKFEQISRYNIPVIGMHTELNTIDNVRPDVRKAAFLVTEYLISKYGPNVGYVSGSQDPITTTGRYRGYADAIVSKNLPIDDSLVLKAEPTYRGGYVAVNQFLGKANLPRSLVFYNEIMAMGAINALQEKGMAIPGTIAVASIDDAIPADHMSLPIPTVSLGSQEMAQVAIELCRRRLNIPNALPVSRKIEPTLIIR